MHKVQAGPVISNTFGHIFPFQSKHFPLQAFNDLLKKCSRITLICCVTLTFVQPAVLKFAAFRFGN